MNKNSLERRRAEIIARYRERFCIPEEMETPAAAVAHANAEAYKQCLIEDLRLHTKRNQERLERELKWRQRQVDKTIEEMADTIEKLPTPDPDTMLVQALTENAFRDQWMRNDVKPIWKNISHNSPDAARLLLHLLREAIDAGDVECTHSPGNPKPSRVYSRLEARDDDVLLWRVPRKDVKRYGLILHADRMTPVELAVPNKKEDRN